LEFETAIKARVVKDYEASDPNPLVMKAREELWVGGRDTTWPAFVRCRNGEGNEGWVPERYLERNGEIGVARVDYSAVELTVSSGEILFLEQEVGGWFWARMEAGERGWIPAAHVETIQPET
jgi:hypothetical protein